LKLSGKKTETKTVDFDVPSHYTGDESVRGKLVDLLLTQDHYTPDNVRSSHKGLYSDEATVIESAVRLLHEKYGAADQIMQLLGVQPEEQS
jgi:hypothetical protein